MRTRHGKHAGRRPSNLRQEGGSGSDSTGATPPDFLLSPPPSEELLPGADGGYLELRALLTDLTPGVSRRPETQEELTRWLLRHRMLGIVQAVGVQKATADDLPEVARRLDRLELAAFGVNARDRVLRGLDELALEFAPKFSGTANGAPSESLRLWYRCLETGATGDAYWTALHALARHDDLLRTEMDLDTFKHTIFSAWKRSGLKRPGVATKGHPR